MNLHNKETFLIVIEKDAIAKLLKIISPEDSLQSKNEQINPNEEIPLTLREREVLRLITQGKNNNEIAASLKMSIYTTKSDVCSILKKLNVSDRLKAAVKAVRKNLI